MEVTHREDKITHAVIGGGDSIHMGITDDAMFMHMLSSTLYSDKELAMTREVLCNAWDAHIEAGCVGTPIEIELTPEKLTIRDFGLGIAHSNMGMVYGTYGKSTKKHDGNQTGGFGLGCKSPFAYTDHFEVISCHEGVKTIYRLTKSSAELNGKPGIVPILQIPTTETGLTVSVDIKNRTDHGRFHQLINRLVANGEINALFGKSKETLQPLKVIEFSKMEFDYAITTAEMLENYQPICIRYGNVIYPLERHDQYAYRYDAVLKVLQQLAIGDRATFRSKTYSIVLQAKGNSISITPSRESLSMEEKTIETVTKLLKKFLSAHTAGFDRACMELVTKTNEEYVKAGKQSLLLRSPSASNLIANTVRSGELAFITDTAKAARGYLNHSYPRNAQFEFKDMMHRLSVLIKEEVYNKGLVQSFRREYRRTSTAIGSYHSDPMQWLLRKVIAPVSLALRADPDMSQGRLMVYDTSGSGGWGYNHDAWAVDQYIKRGSSLSDLLPFLRNIVVLTHSKVNVEKRLQYWKKEDKSFHTLYGTAGGLLIYVVPRTVKKVEAARAFFAKQNVTFIDLSISEVHETAPRVVTSKKDKVLGYPTLASSYSKSRFSQELAKEAVEPEQRVIKPLYFTALNAKSDKYSSTYDLPGIPRAAADLLRELWGDEGAVIFNNATGDKLHKAGVPSAREFLIKQVKGLMKDKEILKYMGSSKSRLIDELDAPTEVVEAINIVWTNPTVLEKLKLSRALPERKHKLLSLFEALKKDHELREDYVASLKIPLTPKVRAFGEKLKANKILPLLDLDVIAVMLRGRSKSEAVSHTTEFFLKALKG